jgi:hypothetical protein
VAADLVEPRGEQGDEGEDREQADDLQRSAAEPSGCEVVGEPLARCRHPLAA